MIARCQAWIRTLAHRPCRLLAAGAVAFAVLAFVGWWSWQHFWIGGPLRRAEASWNKHRLAEALQHLAVGLQRAPRDPDMALLAARVARRLGDLDAAEEFLQWAAAASTPSAIAALERELLDLARRGLSGPAETKLRATADQLSQERSLILEALAEEHVKQYRVPTALALLDQALAAMPDNAVALRLRGRLHLQLADYPEAVRDLRRAADVDPDDADGQQLLADSLVKAGRFAEALPLLKRARQPHEAGILVRLAICSAAQGDLDQAQSLLLQALEQQSNYSVAMLELGRIHFERGHVEAAESWLRKALAADPADRRTHHLLVQCLRLQRKDRQADEQQAKAVQVVADLTRLRQILTDDLAKRPNDADLCHELGALHLRNGQPRPGVHWLEQALKIEANHRATHRALAQYYDQAGQADRAASHREKSQR